ncbi:unnamed protein product [Heterobilharzia americana]|nr:unnamed protein product [Heterobilharzia americana]
MPRNKVSNNFIIDTNRGQQYGLIDSQKVLRHEMKKVFLDPHKAKLIPEQKCQVDFDEKFFDVMKSRSQALRYKLHTSNKRCEIHQPSVNSPVHYVEDDELIDSKYFKETKLDRSAID